MPDLARSIVLIGFKHVGKSVIGRKLAKSLALPFIDLDEVIEAKEQLSCRQIMQTRGEPYFRHLETQALAKILHSDPAIIALGGGTPMTIENQALLQSQLLIHIKAPKRLVFDRIMRNGRPAFFAGDAPAWEVFESLWTERKKIYTKLTAFTVNNQGSLDAAVEQILQQLPQCLKCFK